MAGIFRRLSKSTVGTIVTILFMLAILGAFALQDMQNAGAGAGAIGSGSGLVAVGDAAVTERELSAAMQRRLAEARQQNPEADYSSLADDFGPILQSLIRTRAMQVFAREHDLHISKRLVDAEIAQLPAARGLDGKFSPLAYDAFLQQQRLSDAQVRDVIGGALASRMLLGPAAANARIPVGVATPYASMLLEAREAEVAIVPTQAFAAGIAEPSDADVQRFYAANQGRYMVPEQRVLSIAKIGPEQVANIAASDQEVAAYYRANQAVYAGRSVRAITQKIAPSEAQAGALAQRVRGGAGFGGGTTSLSATREEMTNIAGEAVAAAVFGAKQGDVVGPVRSDLGWHVIKVDTVRTEAGRPLSAVRDEIAARLTTDKRKEALADLVAKVEDSIADGASLAEAAQAARLSVARTPAITAGGVARAQPDYKVPEELAPAVQAGFELGEGDEPVVETLSDEAGYALVGADDIITAAPAPLASIRDQVAADWKAKQARDKARATASAIAAKVQKGTPMAQAVAAAGVRLPPPEKVARRRLEISSLGGNVPPAMGMMFSLAQGRSRMIADPEGRGFVIVKVTKITPGNATLQPSLISRTQTEFQESAANEYAEQMANAIEAAVGVERNEAAIAAAKQRITGSGN